MFRAALAKSGALQAARRQLKDHSEDSSAVSQAIAYARARQYSKDNRTADSTSMRQPNCPGEEHQTSRQ
jgi:hypothetical protein